MYAEIFFTAPSACKYDLETFSGMSGESITPLRSVKNSGTIHELDKILLKRPRDSGAISDLTLGFSMAAK